MRARDPAQKVDCKKRINEKKQRKNLLSHSLPLLRSFSPFAAVLSILLVPVGLLFSIAAIFVYGTSRHRKRGRSDDEKAPGGRAGWEKGVANPGRGSERGCSPLVCRRGRLENRWRGSADRRGWRMADSSEVREKEVGSGKKEEKGGRGEKGRGRGGKRREMGKKRI